MWHGQNLFSTRIPFDIRRCAPRWKLLAGKEEVKMERGLGIRVSQAYVIERLRTNCERLSVCVVSIESDVLLYVLCALHECVSLEPNVV